VEGTGGKNLILNPEPTRKRKPRRAKGRKGERAKGKEREQGTRNKVHGTRKKDERAKGKRQQATGREAAGKNWLNNDLEEYRK
jgi:hypothetical protein